MGLYYFDGLSYVDIGQVLDLETEAVERLHATAIRRVRTMLGR